MIVETNFEKYIERMSGDKFIVAFDNIALSNKRKRIDITIVKQGGNIKANSLTIPTFTVVWTTNDGKTVTYKEKEYNTFQKAYKAFSDVLEKNRNKQGITVKLGFDKESRDAWKDYYPNKMVFRTDGVNTKLVNNIINAVYDVSNALSAEYKEMYDKDLMYIIDKMDTIKRGLNETYNQTLYKSSVDVFQHLYRKWNKVCRKLSEPHNVIGDYSVVPIDTKLLDTLTKQFEVYNNYIFQ